MPINVTDLQNITGFVKAVEFLNEQTGFSFMVLVLTSIQIVIIVLNKKAGFAEGILMSSFVCFILSTILATLGFIPFQILILYLIMMILSGFFVYQSHGKD